MNSTTIHRSAAKIHRINGWDPPAWATEHDLNEASITWRRLAGTTVSMVAEFSPTSGPGQPSSSLHWSGSTRSSWTRGRGRCHPGALLELAHAAECVTS
ncbi:MAG: hypothetical protein ACR2KJ_11265 [Jatrophihabitans sp.]